MVSTIVLVLLPLLAASFTMATTPLPPNGSFPFLGAPEFFTGMWKLRAPNSNATNVLAVNKDAAAFSAYDFFYNPSYEVSEDNKISYPQPFIDLYRYLSYSCLDSNTWVSIYEGHSFCDFDCSPAPSNKVDRFCAIRRIEGNLLRSAITYLVDGQECPSIDQLPQNDTYIIYPEQTPYTGYTTYERLDSAAPLPAVNICINQSNPTEWTKPLPVNESAGPDTPGTPCATYSGKMNDVNSMGFWLGGTADQPGSVALTNTPSRRAKVIWNDDPKKLAVVIGKDGTDECVDGATSKRTNYDITRFADGTVVAGWQCGTYTRQGDGINATLTASEGATAEQQQIVYKQIDETYWGNTTDGKINYTCGAYNLPPPIFPSPPPLNPVPAPAPAPVPASSPAPTLPQTCIYRGIWNIAPLYNPCASKYLAYFRQGCTNPAVVLRSKYKVAASRLKWGLNHDVLNGTSTAGPITAIKDCVATTLSGPPPKLVGAPTLSLQPGPFNFKLVPVSADDCSIVNLVAEKGPGGNGFLTVPSTCYEFVWSANARGRSRFKLTKANELLG